MDEQTPQFPQHGTLYSLTFWTTVIGGFFFPPLWIVTGLTMGCGYLKYGNTNQGNVSGNSSS